jgi:hypothetical protein
MNSTALTKPKAPARRITGKIGPRTFAYRELRK